MSENRNEHNRREFIFNFAIIGAVLVAIGGFIRMVFSYLLPESTKKSYHKYLVARHGELPVGNAKQITLNGQPVFIIRLVSGYRVFSGVCTHLGCIVRWEEQKGRFLCPCHQGIFDKTGKVISGPPPRPLDEFQVKVEDKLVFIMVVDRMEGPWS
jgi:cytochrome b6-f complex iron-sulfur subunit